MLLPHLVLQSQELPVRVLYEVIQQPFVALRHPCPLLILVPNDYNAASAVAPDANGSASAAAPASGVRRAAHAVRPARAVVPRPAAAGGSSRRAARVPNAAAAPARIADG